MFKVIIDYKNGRLREWETLTSGSVGPKLQFEFSPEWEGLIKTVCFDNGEDELPSITLRGDSIEIPNEAMERAGVYLKAGVYGETVDGQLVIPTVYISLGTVNQGAEKTKRPALPKTPDWTTKIENDLAYTVKIAEDIKHRADTGEFGRRDHSSLINRDLTNQHPIEAITGLKSALEEKQASGNYALRNELPTKTSELANDSGFLSELPLASAGQLGCIKVGSGIDVSSDGSISVKSSRYELIERFEQTVSASYSRSVEPDGTPYNFSSLIVKVKCSQGLGKYGHVIVCTGGNAELRNRIGFITLGLHKMNSRIEVFTHNGIMDAVGGYSRKFENGLYDYEAALFSDSYPRPETTINHLALYIENLPEGATAFWEIWGIRK